MIVVSLTDKEIAFARLKGTERQEDNERKGRRAAYSFRGNEERLHQVGCLAELAVSKCLDLPWVPVIDTNDLKSIKSDVGPYQVRSTNYHNGCLLLHDSDRDDDVFILVISGGEQFKLVGWISACDGKKAKFWREDVRHPCYFVPQSALNVLSDSNKHLFIQQEKQMARPRYLGADGYLKPGCKLIGAKLGQCRDSVRSKIYRLLPSDCDTYIEPFLGSGAVVVGKPEHSIEYVNDINHWVINFYQRLQDSPDKVWKQIEHLRNGLDKQKFLGLRKFIREGNGFLEHRDGVPAAAAFYIITKVANNGVIRCNKSGENNSTYCGTTEGRGFYDREWFDKVCQRVENISFSNMDYLEFFKSLNFDPERTVSLLDPPYVTPFTQYYQGGWKKEDHVQLVKFLRHAEFKWILTYNDCKPIRKSYKQFNIIPILNHWSVSNTVDGRGKKAELIITNYDCSL